MDNNHGPKDVLPTLVIGLGGTGFQVIKRLKEMFNKRYNGKKTPVRYLLIDTDLKSFLGDNLENNEKCQLRFGDGIKNTLKWAYDNPNFDWLPQNPKITPDYFTATDQGAGLVRPIGRLYLCKNAKLVYDTILTAKNDLVDLHKVLTDIGSEYLENIDRHKVYIVGSLAGGTGCGTFLDTAVMVSKIFDRDNTNVIGLFTLESCYDDKLSSDLDAQNRSKANCYAALKELEFYMSSIKNSEDEKYIFKYNNIGEIKVEKKLFDICYLIENRNEMGGVLTNIEDIYDLCSLQLFQEIGTALGSQLRADYANFLCKDKDPVLKKDRHFSTFSSSSMEFPVENLKKYCNLRFAKEMLERMGEEGKYDEEESGNTIDRFIESLNNMLTFENMSSNFTSSLRITGSCKADDLKKKYRGNLKRAENEARGKKAFWDENVKDELKEIERFLNDFVYNQISTHGIKYLTDMLKKIDTKLYREKEDVVINTSYDIGSIETEIDNVKDGKKKNQSDPVQGTVTKINNFLNQEYNKHLKYIYEGRYNLFLEYKKKSEEMLRGLLGSIDTMKKDIENLLSRVNFHSQKKYGGNIISREMIDPDFYDSFYRDNYQNKLEMRMREILIKNDPMNIIKEGVQKFVEICGKGFEDVCSKKTITDILKENAESKGLDYNQYIKSELDTTAKLAKPFWSAVKNPEVSWTECYYVGSIKDDSFENGFTIKAPDEIDRWIRNQTGERSRQARYVETTNPHAIDVIHIIMGACAAYLPDIKNYRQFYIKLLSSQTYPLHLNEKYVGLEDIDMDLDEVFTLYSLSRAYGIIFENDKGLYLNIETDGKGLKYVYNLQNCIYDVEFKGEELLDMPKNLSEIPSNLKLGSNYYEVINKIRQDSSLHNRLKSCIEQIENKTLEDDRKKHIFDYVTRLVGNDFIAKEKINQKILAD